MDKIRLTNSIALLPSLINPEDFCIYYHKQTENVYIVCMHPLVQGIMSSTGIVAAIVEDLNRQKLEIANTFVITNTIYADKILQHIDIESFQKVIT